MKPKEEEVGVGGEEVRPRAARVSGSPVDTCSTRRVAETEAKTTGQQSKIDGSAKRGKVGEHGDDDPFGQRRANRPTACHSSWCRTANQIPRRPAARARPLPARRSMHTCSSCGSAANVATPFVDGDIPFHRRRRHPLTGPGRSHRSPLSRPTPTTRR